MHSNFEVGYCASALYVVMFTLTVAVIPAVATMARISVVFIVLCDCVVVYVPSGQPPVLTVPASLSYAFHPKLCRIKDFRRLALAQ